MKKWYRSKTIWFNILITSLIGIEQNIPVLQGIIPESYYGIILFAATMGNIFLRTITTSAVTK